MLEVNEVIIAYIIFFLVGILSVKQREYGNKSNNKHR